MLLAFGVDLGLIALHVVNLQGITPAGRPLRFFDVDDEVNLPTWWASVQLFSIGLLLGLVAVRRAPRAWIARIGLWVLAAAFFGMSLDEFAQLHERLGQATRTGVLPVTGAWPLILGPLALVVIGGALLAARRYLRDPQALAIMAGGLVLYVVAAAGIELTLNAVALGSVEHELQVIAEELGEFLGATLLLWGAYRLALARTQLPARAGLRDAGGDGAASSDRLPAA